MVGKVKWFDGKKGFGFLTPADGSEEVFVHHSAIQMKGYRQLEPGQAVAFDVVSSDKGLKALNVTALFGGGDASSPIPQHSGGDASSPIPRRGGAATVRAEAARLP